MDALEILIDRLFDHSGTFPPASRSLDEALQDAVSFPTSLYRPHLVGTDLVATVPMLEEIQARDPSSFGLNRVLRFSLLGSPICSDPVTEDISREVEAVLRFMAHPHRTVVSFEVKLTGVVLTDAHLAALDYLRASLPAAILIACEPDLTDPRWEKRIAALIEWGRGAIKVRCSGTPLTRHMLARIIELTASRPLKTTGGLHHPFVEPDRYGNEFGFLTLAAAVFLRRAHRSAMTHEIILRLLTATHPTQLTLSDRLAYSGLSLSPTDLSALKSTLPFSIGSCSLADPDADLLRHFTPKGDAHISK